MLKPFYSARLSFEKNREIGQEGKNSKVFLVKDCQLNAELVIKEIPKSKFPGKDQFFLEAQILHLSSHSNVVPVHYACEDDDSVYIAIPYFSRGSLNHVLNCQFLTVREILRFAHQFVSGLNHIHSKGLIHFDIKPDNILISNNGEAVLSDFGLAKTTDFRGYASQDRMYFKQIPPEGLVTESFDRTFDIYQTGLTLYRMCNGNSAFYRQLDAYGEENEFNADSFKFDVRNGRFPSRNDFLPHIPPKLRSVIKKCLKPEAYERYQSAVELLNDLASVDGPKLDWQYFEEAGIRRWKKVRDDKETILMVHEGGKSDARKVNLKSGRTQRIKEFVGKQVGDMEIREFLRAY